MLSRRAGLTASAALSCLKHEAILKLQFFHKIKTKTESENETVTILAVMYLVIYMPCWIVGISCVGTAGGQGTSK